jgi:hypothetical protein
MYVEGGVCWGRAVEWGAEEVVWWILFGWVWILVVDCVGGVMILVLNVGGQVVLFGDVLVVN